LYTGSRHLRSMPRLLIDITPEEHQKLKAITALKGQSIKEYVLKRTLGEAPALDGMSEEDAFSALADYLQPRIEQARRGELGPVAGLCRSIDHVSCRKGEHRWHHDQPRNSAQKQCVLR